MPAKRIRLLEARVEMGESRAGLLVRKRLTIILESYRINIARRFIDVCGHHAQLDVKDLDMWVCEGKWIPRPDDGHL